MRSLRKYNKFIAVFIILTFFTEIIRPTVVQAITGHDTMPEYGSFEPVTTTNMVNLFDGSFTYNIPLIEVPNGYPISLSYHSNDVSNESLASWVGLGWNINPGTINRIKRGFPDEFNGKNVTYHNRTEANWTIGGGAHLGLEFFGNEGLLNLDIGAQIRYNNYNGIGTSVSAGLNFAGVANLDFSYSQGKYGFNPEINPFQILNVADKISDRKARKTFTQNMSKSDKKKYYSVRRAAMAHQKAEQEKRTNFGMSVGAFGASRGNYFSARMLPPVSYPVTLSKYSGFMASVRVDAGVNFLPPPIDPEIGVNVNYSRQNTEEEVTKKVYGYYYNEKAWDDKESMMDYFTEKEKMFEKRDNILGYPLPDYDIYSLSGEALGGTFRPFRSEYGHYRKNRVYSDEYSVNVGADITLASVTTFIPMFIPVNLDYTTGFELGGGYHYTKIGTWNNEGDAANYKFHDEDDVDVSGNKIFGDSDEKFFFRFSGDKAGYFDLNGFNDSPFKAGLTQSTWDGFIKANIEIDDYWSDKEPLIDYRSNEKHKKRSTYINYHTNADFGSEVNEVKYKVFEKELYLADPVGATPYAYDHTEYNHDAIGEIVTYNNDGVTYVYGLPVYARNEKQLQYSLEKDQLGTVFSIEANGLIANITEDIDEDARRKLGYESGNSSDVNEYPTTYLLTQILGPDYVDRTGNGPSPDDFGSYTRFDYAKVYGGGGPDVNNWYTYRNPYNGVNYSYNSLSSNKDDMGSFSWGEKEAYYLYSISSKTHAAIFTLGDRDDGKSANLSGNYDINKIIKGSSDSYDKKPLNRLESINLYTIKDCEFIGQTNILKEKSDAVPIKTVYFEYYNDNEPDKALCKKVPNADNEGGKLTLKKVWFEYNGKKKSKISPYIFEYKYPSSDNPDDIVEYPIPYKNDVFDPTQNPDGIQNYGGLPLNVFDDPQNPDYKVVNTDRWGNYRDYYTMLNDEDGDGYGDNTGKHNLGDLAKFWPYVHQNPDPEKYDPAAFCLKRIILPTGGEIHVQYEQNDYQYVQDKRAMVMIPLKEGTDYTVMEETGTVINGKPYYLDLFKIGIDYGEFIYDITRQRLANDLFFPMKEDKKRIYFNFLYALLGENPDYRHTHSDYIEGYARINGYGYDNDGIYFTFKGTSGTNYTPINYSSQESNRELPRKVCKDFYKTQRVGMIDMSNNTLEQAHEEQGSESFAQTFVNMITNFSDQLDGKCRYMKPDMSYVRVRMPAIKKKRGGGVRVKRLLMYDSGIIKDGVYNQPVLYGNEYSYNTELKGEEGIVYVVSSGVATNEPGVGRRECALVNPIDKDHQSKFNAILYGRDMYGQEEPLGESLLPAPAIGYSRIKVKNIHSGKTSTGYETHKYYTVKDYPFKADKTSIKEVNVPVSFNASMQGISVGYTRKAPYLSQGYSFKSYNMHGQLKEISKYSNNDAVITQENYEYFRPGDKVTVMGEDMFLRNDIPYEQLGKESEILSEIRQVEDYSFAGKIGVDITLGTFVLLLPPLFAPPLILPGGYSTSITGGGMVTENILSTHVTSKIISYPALLKKVTRRVDGILHTTENIVFDDNTGQPVVTRSYDDFKGSYLNQNFMASWKYDNLQSKYQNERSVIEQNFTYGNDGNLEWLELAGSTNIMCNALAKFTKGDFIELIPGNHLYYVDDLEIENSRLYIVSSMYNQGIHPSDGSIITQINIIKSGYTNQLSLPAGNIVFHDVESNMDADNIFSGTEMIGSNEFSLALNTIWPTQGNYNEGEVIPLPGGPYTMDISFYSGYFNCENIDVTNAIITNINIIFNGQWPNITLTIQSFKVYCNGEWIPVDCYP